MSSKYPVSPCILDRPGAQAQVGDFFIPSVEPQGSIFLSKIIGYTPNDAPHRPGHPARLPEYPDHFPGNGAGMNLPINSSYLEHLI